MGKKTDERLRDLMRQLEARADFPLEKVHKKVAIISTPRSGSSMFCDILHNTELCGEPREWINMRYLDAYARVTGTKNIDITAYLHFIIRKTTSANGIFAINFHVEQHQAMLKHKVDIFDLGFDRCYYVYRRQKALQAYSLARASVTDQWSADTEPAREAEEELGFSRILGAMTHLAQSEAFHERHLKSRVDRAFFYEDFSRVGETRAYQAVFDDLEVEVAGLNPRTGLARQRASDMPAELERLRAYLWPEA